ncbi:MAG: RAD55 family ATPase [Candidatus Thermoplasmatota archaeon]|nr:RAD55 family ATPase [Candidatus Thermoplasmatota archaeon]MCL5984213.1 RAD55 family ATPase [Candidatus Thermoplasmatota archaeon]
MKTKGPTEAIFGIPEIDSQLGGVLPKGWAGILTGAPGSGIELLAKQFTGFAPEKVPVYYYTTIERTEDVLAALRGFGWKENINLVNILEEYYDQVLSLNLEVSRFREMGISPEDISQFTMKGIKEKRVNFVTRMINDIATLDKPFRLVVDSLDFFLEQAEASDVISMVRQIRYRAQRVGGRAIMTLTPQIHDNRVTGTLETIADVLLSLEVEERSANFRYAVAIEKVRNHPESTGLIRVNVGEEGIVSASGEGKH